MRNKDIALNNSRIKCFAEDYTHNCVKIMGKSNRADKFVYCGFVGCDICMRSKLAISDDGEYKYKIIKL